MSNEKDAVAMQQTAVTVNELMENYVSGITVEMQKISATQIQQNVVTQKDLFQSLLASTSGSGFKWSQYLAFTSNQIEHKSKVLSNCIQAVQDINKKFQAEMYKLKEEAEGLVES